MDADVRARLAIWAGTLVVVVAAAVFAWHSPRMEPQPAGASPPTVLLPDRVNRAPLPGSMWTAASGAPMLIVIENTPEARPQSGLADACLVYVLPTEARITRFLAGYCDNAPAVIGPVRSVRRYMLDIASDLGAILVHAGYSGEALALITQQKLPVLNEFWTPGPFWRDSTRQMPHNLYTGLDRLRAALAKKPMEAHRGTIPFKIAATAAAAAPDASPATNIALDYGPLYAVRYHYDAGRGHYLREQDGRPHLDADGRQIAPTSVLVVFVHWWYVEVNGTQESKIDTIGGGRLAVLTGGMLSEGTWARSKGGPLKLLDRRGQPIVLPQGPVWIEFFPNDLPFAVQPETPR
jgi:hypothetical protein